MIAANLIVAKTDKITPAEENCSLFFEITAEMALTSLHQEDSARDWMVVSLAWGQIPFESLRGDVVGVPLRTGSPGFSQEVQDSAGGMLHVPSLINC